MQVLEKILKEIDAHAIEFEMFGISDDYISVGWVKEIIRNHMNDGWIPVDERLPDNNEDVLVTTDAGLITFGYFSNGKWITDQEPDYPIVWQPLPAPYRPERSKE